MTFIDLKMFFHFRNAPTFSACLEDSDPGGPRRKRLPKLSPKLAPKNFRNIGIFQDSIVGELQLEQREGEEKGYFRNGTNAAFFLYFRLNIEVSK